MRNVSPFSTECIICATRDANYELFIPKLNFQYCCYFIENTKLLFPASAPEKIKQNLQVHLIVESRFQRTGTREVCLKTGLT